MTTTSRDPAPRVPANRSPARRDGAAELAAFLRARRARLTPRQAGLPEAGTPGHRRTPGLLPA
jgi:hypothetical protein